MNGYNKRRRKLSAAAAAAAASVAAVDVDVERTGVAGAGWDLSTIASIIGNSEKPEKNRTQCNCDWMTEPERWRHATASKFRR